VPFTVERLDARNWTDEPVDPVFDGAFPGPLPLTLTLSRWAMSRTTMPEEHRAGCRFTGGAPGSACRMSLGR